MTAAHGTYVYAIVGAARRPTLADIPPGLAGTGRVRLLDVERGLFLAVADAPLGRYSEAAIAKGLSDLDWVSRAAVAHERVVESFVTATAVLPMKLFTIFTSDERAIEHVRADRRRIAAIVKRVANRQEWGVRVVLDRARAWKTAAAKPAARAPASSGATYLTRKKAQRDASIELAERAKATVDALHDRLSARADLARRRTMSELPSNGGPLLIDAAYLIARGRAKAFRALAAREARALQKHGYLLTLTGPWPPYTFVQE